ncbi:ParA family partition ATPase [Acidocella aminolytica]|uniref:Cobyrinic acid a,c-diamide synthase/plasmid partitioning family protein ParA/MinD n=1 Tax=Acidocella aminolytica 101 = DSM 11237 TaxID=1120923 RepID=A0A0D6PBJ9_9PROT|nr:ParA family partition ATPase [Acidocella aminolytica]GAN78721.1 cobyrinic acid a,c-diamide synthase/plasmid partitioning family protein ParA/MinD [Acidocella aminolytica 101 = DSM 11237]GBQ38675.1 chromosome partitioning ATPase [Acidocella aminolytica 101 = DSM 11237]SHE78465.1 plasmid segregation oscillating ATPase ParF [Acidocella aminolytica 101 = DSM 11237]
MGKIIAVAQQKGGAGKTMIAAQFGTALAEEGRVALLDTDPQASLSAWGRLRGAAAKAKPGVEVFSVSGWRLANELEKLKAEYDYVIVDTPPVIDSDARRAIRGADLVLVPLNPAPPDLWAAEGTLKLAAEERSPAALLFNRAAASSRLRKRLEAEIVARQLTLLPAALANRAGYANAFADGLGVTEAGPNTQAAEEVRAAVRALLALGF